MPNNRHEEVERYLKEARKYMAHVAFEALITPSPCLDSERLGEQYFARRGAEETKTFNLEQIITILTMIDHDILLAIIDGTLHRRAVTDLQT
ncbi:hypothetical protein V493_04049 [Pseudogymnoascus sp. VKM F-4281 (FW-2241)]|nr:hypothetical protein V493_04049 [Pseudogymnoascus sp. VKM F-4281 (FW-2241)]